ncbi:ABC transporter permease [Nonomuraea diastatica]|uniref:ABC transporter permease n=1 Tax=Nonomuraea diastatica TaxID=1848329 RepID=UPI001C7013D8|nr:anibiotic ABC transporter efflux pump [Nonomuraea diastatica]
MSTTAPVPAGGAVTAAGTLARFILRQNRLRLPLWILLAGGLVLGNAGTYADLFSADQALADRVDAVLNNPAVLAATGPGYGLAEATVGNLGPLVVNDSSSVFILAALMSVLLVVRHTRAEEESGSTELVRAAAVGPHAPLAAALAVAAAANVALGLVLAAGLAGMGLPVAGSVAFGSSVSAVGMAFAAIAGAVGQLIQHSRAVTGITLAGVLGLSFVLRGIGDISGSALSWSSPIGWAQAMRPYAQERWWPLLFLVALAAAGVAAAFLLGARRDFGGGSLRPRPGRALASARLRGPFSLAVRLQRGTLGAWTAGLFVLGLFGGGMVSALDAAQTVQSDVYRQLFGGGGSERFADHVFVYYLRLMALFTCVCAVLSGSRARAEEGSGRADAVLAAAVSRRRWVLTQLGVAVAGSAVVLLSAGLGAGLAYGAATGEAAQVLRLVAGAYVHLPAIALLTGIAFLLYGLAPRWSGLVWAVVAYAFFASLFGRALGLPGWLLGLSVVELSPDYPETTAGPPALIVLTAVALALTVAAVRGFERRDLHPDI